MIGLASESFLTVTVRLKLLLDNLLLTGFTKA